MMSKKVLPVVAIVLLGGILWAFKTSGKTPGDDQKTKQQQLLVTIGAILEKRHYDPKQINDSFSREIFKDYLSSLDQDKDLFLQSDINSLKKYETTIDDEIHGDVPLEFYPVSTALYQQRLKESPAIYKEILSKPFSFTTDEKVQMDADKNDYPADEAARKEAWRKRLKYYTLDRFVDLQTQRDKAGPKDSLRGKTDAQLEKEARQTVQTIMDRIYERQVKTFNQEDQFSDFINVITNAMDPHTNYYPPVAKRTFDEDMSGRFYGIGALLKEEDGQIKIASVVTGSPAWKTGKVQPNDVIVKVAQGNNAPVDITGYGTTDAVKLIRGDKNTEVRLTLKKPDGTQVVVPITRGEITLDETFARSAVINDGNKKIGYIFLPEFYLDVNRADGAKCSQDVANEVKKLEAENVQGIIMDLRGNPGGSLPEVVNMAGLFIKSGPIVQAKDKDGKPIIWRDEDDSVLYTGPMAVMVNEGSASASEIFAAAMQDYHRAIIVGSSSTYGKGTVQKPVPVLVGNSMDMFTNAADGTPAALVLTFEKFYRITGGSTQRKGVTPDIIIPDAYEYFKFREKDNPSALPWDQIQKTDYTPWTPKADFSQVEAQINQQINSDSAFVDIRRNTAWLGENADKEFNLNINKYKAQMEELKKVSHANDSLAKLSKPLDIKPPVIDANKYFNNPDTIKGERNKQWLQTLEKDRYVDETVNVIKDMIASGSGNVAKQ